MNTWYYAKGSFMTQAMKREAQMMVLILAAFPKSRRVDHRCFIMLEVGGVYSYF